MSACAVSYALVGVSIPVFGCIYNPCRPCILRFPDLRAINIYGIIYNSAATVGPVIVANSINRYIVIVRNIPDFGNPRTGYIGAVIINISIVNNCCSVYNINYPGMRYIVIINIRTVNISLRCAYPIRIGYPIAIAK